MAHALIQMGDGTRCRNCGKAFDRNENDYGPCVGFIQPLSGSREILAQQFLADPTVPVSLESQDELARSIAGAILDCPHMSSDKVADYLAAALWPHLVKAGLTA